MVNNIKPSRPQCPPTCASYYTNLFIYVRECICSLYEHSGTEGMRYESMQYSHKSLHSKLLPATEG